MKIQIIRTVMVAFTLALAGCFGAAVVSANPTGSQPNRPLAAHGTISEAKDLVASLYKLYDEEEKFVIETFAKKTNPAKFSDKRISKSYGRLWKAIRDAGHLKLMGEPAGDDLERKLNPLIKEVYNFGLAYRGTPRGGPLVQRITAQLNKEKPKMARFLEQAQGALKQGKLEIFETQMEAKGIDLYEKLVFFSPVARQPYQSQFMGVLGSGDTLLTRKRKEDYMARASEVMSKQTVAATEFPAEAKRIRDEIASSGTAKLGGDKTAGPVEAFAHVASLWGDASAGLIRATAIQWAFTNRTDVQVQPDPKQLKSVAVQSLASIIEAAAVSTPAENVQAVYSDLLKQVSAVERRNGRYSKDVYTGCEAALAKLAAKDPALSARITAYRRATSEPLRWRKVFAAQQAKNLSQQFPVTLQALESKAAPAENIRPNFVRQLGRETITAPSTFNQPANWMVQEAAIRLVGKPVFEDQMIRLSPTSRTAVVPHASRHYGNVPVPMPSETEIQDLQSAIVVDDTHGPLTIESAGAVSAGELQDYVSVSGLVQAVHLESVVTRFIGLPDAAYTLAALGRVPRLPEDLEPRAQTCWRLDLKPMWAHHPYYTVRVTSKTQ